MLASKAAARRKRADQRHFPILVFFQPYNTRQRLSGNAVRVHAKKLGEFRRKRDDAQFLIGRPFVPGSTRFSFGAAAEDCGKPRPGRSTLGPPLERQSDLVSL